MNVLWRNVTENVLNLIATLIIRCSKCKWLFRANNKIIIGFQRLWLCERTWNQGPNTNCGTTESNLPSGNQMYKGIVMRHNITLHGRPVSTCWSTSPTGHTSSSNGRHCPLHADGSELLLLTWTLLKHSQHDELMCDQTYEVRRQIYMCIYIHELFSTYTLREEVLRKRFTYTATHSRDRYKQHTNAPTLLFTFFISFFARSFLFKWRRRLLHGCWSCCYCWLLFLLLTVCSLLLMMATVFYLPRYLQQKNDEL